MSVEFNDPTLNQVAFIYYETQEQNLEDSAGAETEEVTLVHEEVASAEAVNTN